jgi:hypothetical protein
VISKTSVWNFISRVSNKHRKTLVWVPFIFLSITLVNLALVNQDIWDGVIFAYGYEVGDLRGWERNMDESGWESAGPLIFLSVFIGELLGGNYFLGYKIIAGLALSFLTYEVFRSLATVLNLNHPWPALGSALAISSGVWTASAGSAMIWHVVALPLVFVSIRWIYTPSNPILNFLGFIFLVPSFSLNSVVAFAPALAAIYEWSKKSEGSQMSFISAKAWKLYAVGTLGVLYALYQTFFNPKFGRYGDYNSVEASLSGMQTILVVQAIFWFASFSAPVLGIILMFLTLEKADNKPGKKGLLLLIKDRAVLSSLILLAASAAPYIAVGKAPVFYEVWDWQGRHGFLFAVALAALAASALAQISTSAGSVLRSAARIAIGATALLSLLIQTAGFQWKIDRNEFDQSLTRAMSSVMPVVPEGYVVIETVGGPIPAHSVGYQYDLQYLIFKATHEARWLTTDNPQAHLEKTPIRFLDPIDNLRDIYSGTTLKCTSEIRILGQGWGVPFGPAIRTLLSKEAPKLELELGATSCSP